MKTYLYDLIAHSCIAFAGVTDFVANLLILVTVKVFTFNKVTYAHLCMWLLKRVDGERVKGEQSETERLKSMLELALMQAAIRIKESAEADDSWTDDHSEALNMVGVRLIEECQWDSVSVHSYFKPLVESIEGLDYEE